MTTPKYHKINSLYKRDKVTHKFADEVVQPEFIYFEELLAQEKLDGMNMRAIWDVETQSFSFGGRGDNSKIPGPLMEFMLHHFTVENIPPNLRGFPVTFFGEGFGGKIQKGHEYGDQRFAMFDVLVHKEWLNQWEVALYAAAFGVEYPETRETTLEDAQHTVAEGFVSDFGTCQAEGLILRPPIELLNSVGDRVITKLKTKDFQ